MSNLRSIGRAIQMYQQDYRGSSATALSDGSPMREGCPPALRSLASYGVAPAQLFCASALHRRDAEYGYHSWNPDSLPGDSTSDGAVRALRYRFIHERENYPLVYDSNHMAFREQVAGPANWLVLRWDGRVERVRRPVSNSVGL
jgi:hypothetical protein